MSIDSTASVKRSQDRIIEFNNYGLCSSAILPYFEWREIGALRGINRSYYITCDRYLNEKGQKIAPQEVIPGDWIAKNAVATKKELEKRFNTWLMHVRPGMSFEVKMPHNAFFRFQLQGPLNRTETVFCTNHDGGRDQVIQWHGYEIVPQTLIGEYKANPEENSVELHGRVSTIFSSEEKQELQQKLQKIENALQKIEDTSKDAYDTCILSLDVYLWMHNCLNHNARQRFNESCARLCPKIEWNELTDEEFVTHFSQHLEPISQEAIIKMGLEDEFEQGWKLLKGMIMDRDLGYRLGEAESHLSLEALTSSLLKKATQVAKLLPPVQIPDTQQIVPISSQTHVERKTIVCGVVLLAIIAYMLRQLDVLPA